jgi:hypothetical protein
MRALILLPRPAPHGGSTFELSCDESVLLLDQPLLDLPKTVYVPEGQMVSEFEVETEPVGKSTSVAVRANHESIEETVHVMLRPEVDFVIQPDPNWGGGFYRAVVTVPVASPTDMRVAVQAPEAVKLPSGPIVLQKGRRSVQFPLQVSGTQPVPVTIRYDQIERQVATLGPMSADVARLASNAAARGDSPDRPIDAEAEGEPAMRNEPVAAAEVDVSRHVELDLSTDRIPGGDPVAGRIALSGSAPLEPVEFQVISHDPTIVHVPPTVVLAPGQREVTFPISTRAVPAEQVVDVTVRCGQIRKTVELTLTIGFEIAATFDRREGSASGIIRLRAPAPSEGMAFELKCNAPQVARLPDVAVVPPGETSAAFPISFSGRPQTVTIIGTHAGLSRAFIFAPPSTDAKPRSEVASQPAAG